MSIPGLRVRMGLRITLRIAHRPDGIRKRERNASSSLLMETLNLPLRFTRPHYAARRPSNLFLDGDTKKKATAIALHRYGYSLSELVNQLLKMELKLKEGLLTKTSLGRRK